jgi:hypothetical protein
MHGKLAALHRFRKNGFLGAGLNDATWGLAYNGATSAYYEVEIQTAGTPDQFRWRKNGGSWTSNVAITGAAQTLDSLQTITFAATTGHTVLDKWVIGNLANEGCTEGTNDAQITDSTKRILNPNQPPTFTDSGAKKVLVVDHTRGKAVFDGVVTIVDVDGNNGYVPEIALEKIAYLIGWSLDISLDMADASRCGQQWKEGLPGMAGGRGGANAYLIGGKSFMDDLKAGAAGTQKFFLMELFNYDPDQDQTGDHFLCWATITGLSPSAGLAEVVKEPVTFELVGIPSFVSNV